MENVDPGMSLELVPGYADLSKRARTGIVNWCRQDGESKTVTDLIEAKKSELRKVKGVGSGALSHIWNFRDALMGGNGSNGNGKAPKSVAKAVKIKKGSGYVSLIQVLETGDDDETGVLVLKIDAEHCISVIETERVTHTMITHQTPFEAVKYRVAHTPAEVLKLISEA
jgi:hypothetical protein